MGREEDFRTPEGKKISAAVRALVEAVITQAPVDIAGVIANRLRSFTETVEQIGINPDAVSAVRDEIYSIRSSCDRLTVVCGYGPVGDDAKPEGEDEKGCDDSPDSPRTVTGKVKYSVGEETARASFEVVAGGLPEEYARAVASAVNDQFDEITDRVHEAAVNRANRDSAGAWRRGWLWGYFVGFGVAFAVAKLIAG